MELDLMIEVIPVITLITFKIRQHGGDVQTGTHSSRRTIVKSHGSTEIVQWLSN